jgi:uncharacterized protein
MAKAGCPAHDLAHCYRVANLAVKIAHGEIGADVKVVYVAGMLHDVLDTKLYGVDKIGAIETMLRTTLANSSTATIAETTRDDEGKEVIQLTPEEIDLVFVIIKSVGYKNLIKPDWDVYSLPLEYRCVQDADLLDAIGAIGIGRCFSFGGKHERALFGEFSVISAQEKLDPAVYAAYQKSATSNTVAHFFDKLLRLKDFMSTFTGKEMAKERHSTMLLFLRVLDMELEDANDASQGYISKYIDMFDDSLPAVSSTMLQDDA